MDKQTGVLRGALTTTRRAAPSGSAERCLSTRPPPDEPAARNDDPVWVAKHAELTKLARQGEIDLYFAGDSITRRWAAD